MYNSERKMSEQSIKVRIGPKEKEILMYIHQQGLISATDLTNYFCSSTDYMIYFNQVVKRMLAKGLIDYIYAKSPETGRRRKMYFLTPLGVKVFYNLKQ